ncbi:hypothetical protein CNO13_05695 (plasmid) [Borrelia miyamotoi]|uniref:Uncharacterized protein n=1 Tax=Borrelia miyamotoi TaxID=47466 RepID=A0ABN5DX35_9SPIR|nr:hypothetical protein CNO13_05695 [Borrelia miyamotoi]
MNKNLLVEDFGRYLQRLVSNDKYEEHYLTYYLKGFMKKSANYDFPFSKSHFKYEPYKIRKGINNLFTNFFSYIMKISKNVNLKNYQ